MLRIVKTYSKEFSSAAADKRSLITICCFFRINLQRKVSLQVYFLLKQPKWCSSDVIVSHYTCWCPVVSPFLDEPYPCLNRDDFGSPQVSLKKHANDPRFQFRSVQKSPSDTISSDNVYFSSLSETVGTVASRRKNFLSTLAVPSHTAAKTGLPYNLTPYLVRSRRLREQFVSCKCAGHCNTNYLCQERRICQLVWTRRLHIDKQVRCSNPPMGSVTPYNFVPRVKTVRGFSGTALKE